MTKKPIDLNVHIFEGKDAELFKGMSDQLESQTHVGMLFHRALTIALMKLGENVTVSLADVVNGAPLPYELDYYASEKNTVITFLAKRKGDPTPLDKRMTDGQIMITAMMGAYLFNIHKQSGGTIKTFVPAKPKELLEPSTAMLIMAQSHWHTLSDMDKSFHKGNAKAYVETAIKEGLWPKESE